MASCVAASASISNPSVGAVASLRLERSLIIPGQLALPLPCLVSVKMHSSVSRKQAVSKVVMSASQRKELEVAAPMSAALLMAAMVIPEIAEAAQPGISPSLKNLLLSVAAGGVVALVLGVAVAGVSVFDPVKRR